MPVRFFSRLFLLSLLLAFGWVSFQRAGSWHALAQTLPSQPGNPSQPTQPTQFTPTQPNQPTPVNPTQPGAPTGANAISNSVSSAPSGQACNITNNTAALSGDTGEAKNTVKILQWGCPNKDALIADIEADNEPIIRLGVRKFSSSNEALNAAESMVSCLQEIRNATSKPFIVQASNNEANCAEVYPGAFLTERLIAGKIAGAQLPNVKYITGQIDIYCGYEQLKPGEATEDDKQPPTAWVELLANTPNISGVALPFYTGDVVGGNVEQAVALFTEAVAAAGGKEIYITESGPYKAGSAKPNVEEFISFVNGLNRVRESAVVAALFNALGENPDPNFKYTSPFWNKSCRETLRNDCTNETAIREKCFPDIEEHYILPICTDEASCNDKMLLADTMIRQLNYQPQCLTKDEVAFIQGEIQGGEDYTNRTGNLPPTVSIGGDIKTETPDEFPAIRTDKNPLDDTSDKLKTALSGELNLTANPTSAQLKDYDLSEQAVIVPSIYRLLTSNQDMGEVKAQLKACSELCNALENPDACAQRRPITEQYDCVDLYDRIKNTSAEELASPTFRKDNPTVAEALDNTPLTLDRVFYQTYLVTVTEKLTSSFFDFWPFDNGGGGKHEVTITPMLLPGPLGDSIPEDYTLLSDGYSTGITKEADALVPYQILKQEEANKKDLQEKIYQATIQPVEGQEKHIDCTTETCQEPLVATLIDIVNGAYNNEEWSKECSDLREILGQSEESDIKANIKLEEPESEGFTLRGGFNFLANLFRKIRGNLGSAEIPFTANLKTGLEKGGERVKTFSYVIGPGGANERILLGADVMRPYQIEGDKNRLARTLSIQAGANVSAEPQSIPYDYLDNTVNPPASASASINYKVGSTTSSNEPKTIGIGPSMLKRASYFVPFFDRDTQETLDQCIDSGTPTDYWITGKCEEVKATAPTTEKVDQCYTKTATNLPQTRDDLQRMICDAAAKFEVPGYLIAGVLKIESDNTKGGRAIKDLLDYGTQLSSTTMECPYNATKDIGQLGINQPTWCTENTAKALGLPGQEALNLCNFEIAVQTSAYILKAGSGLGNTPRSAMSPGDIYQMAGAYHSNNQNCVKVVRNGGDPRNFTLDTVVDDMSYCRFASTAYDNTWACLGDPVYSAEIESYL